MVQFPLFSLATFSIGVVADLVPVCPCRLADGSVCCLVRLIIALLLSTLACARYDCLFSARCIRHGLELGCTLPARSARPFDLAFLQLESQITLTCDSEVVQDPKKKKINLILDAETTVLIEPDEDLAGWLEVCQKAVPRRYFGAEMSDWTKESTELPEFVDLALVALEGHMKVDGLFRISGSKTEIEALRDLYNCGARPSTLITYDVHTLTGALKLYLRTLPTPLVPFTFYSTVLNLANSTDIPGAFASLLAEFPLQSQIVLKAVCTFMQRVAGHSGDNQMTPSNLAIVVGPNLVRPQSESLESAAHAQHAIPVFTAVFDNAEAIFADVPDGRGLYFNNLGSAAFNKRASSNNLRKSVRPQPPSLLLAGLSPPPPAAASDPVAPSSPTGPPPQFLPPVPGAGGVLPAPSGGLKKSGLMRSLEERQAQLNNQGGGGGGAGGPPPALGAPPPTLGAPPPSLSTPLTDAPSSRFGDGIQKSPSASAITRAATTGGLKRPMPAGAIPLVGVPESSPAPALPQAPLPTVPVMPPPEPRRAGLERSDSQNSDSAPSVASPAPKGTSSASLSTSSPAPPDDDECAQWKTYTSDDGHKYYHNEVTDAVTWEKPDCLKRQRVKKHRKAPSATGASKDELSAMPSGGAAKSRRKTDRAQTTTSAPNMAAINAIAATLTSPSMPMAHVHAPAPAPEPAPPASLPPMPSGPVPSASAPSLPQLPPPSAAKHSGPVHTQSMPVSAVPAAATAPIPASHSPPGGVPPQRIGSPKDSDRIKTLEDKIASLEKTVQDQAEDIRKILALLQAQQSH